MNNVKKIKPTGLFTNYIYKAIPLAFDESMSYYETLCGLLAYLKDTVIPTVNNNADVVIELQTLYEELKTYVDNYFENLDVQEEINNKLDEMVEDGTIDRIINQEIFQNINNEINEINDTIDKKLPEYKPINMIQDLSVTFPLNTSIQGFTIDDNNNIYIYVIKDNEYGDIYKYNLINHNYVGKFENLKLYHGNDLLYKNNKIYVASTISSNGQSTNKIICIYDLLTGIVTEINPFNDLNYANVVSLCDYDENNIIVALNQYVGNSDTSNVKLVKLNLINLSYQEINTIYYTEITPSRIIGISMINNKLYLLTDSPKYMIEYNYDDTTLTATENKIYKISNKNELNIDLGELEGINILPSGLYGENTFAFSSFIINNEIYGKANYKIYLSSITSDLVSYMGSEQDTNIMQKSRDIYVNASSTNNLENGTSDFPFHDINTAINYMNSSPNAIDYIIIQDNSTYIIGKHINKHFNIKSNNNAILQINTLINCNVKINGSNITIEKTGASLNHIILNNTKLIISDCTLKSYIYCNTGCDLFFKNVNMIVDYNYANAFEINASRAILYINTLTYNATRLLRVWDGSVVYLNYPHREEPMAIQNGIVTITTSS